MPIRLPMASNKCLDHSHSLTSGYDGSSTPLPSQGKPMKAISQNSPASQLPSATQPCQPEHDPLQPQPHPKFPLEFDTAKKRCELTRIFLSIALEAVKSNPESYDTTFLDMYSKRHLEIGNEREFCNQLEWDSLTRWHFDESVWAVVEAGRLSNANVKQEASPVEALQIVARDVKEGVKMMFDQHEKKLLESPFGLQIYNELTALQAEAERLLKQAN